MVGFTLSAVVLAAGKSERMGTNKLLLEVGGLTILDRILTVLESVTDEVIVVLGHRPEELKPIVKRHNAVPVLNLDYERGMTTSIKAGLRYASGDAAFIVLGDQIGLGSGLLNSMVSIIISDPEALIVSPVYKGRRGHPILVRKTLFQEIQALEERETLREVIIRHDDAHRFVEGGVWCIMDIDTPEEFENAKRLFENRYASS